MPSTSPITPDLQAKITNWRMRSVEGTLTLEEMKEAIQHLRAGRLSAATAAKSSKKKAVAPPAEDLLSELEGL